MAASKRKFVRMDSRRRFWLLAGGVAGASVFFSLGVAVGRLWPQTDPLELDTDGGTAVRAVAPVTFQGVPRDVYTVDEGLRRRAAAATAGSGASAESAPSPVVTPTSVAVADAPGAATATAAVVPPSAAPSVGLQPGNPSVGVPVAPRSEGAAAADEPERTLARASTAQEAPAEALAVPPRPTATAAAEPSAAPVVSSARSRVVTRTGGGGGRPFEFVAVDVSERSVADAAAAQLRGAGLDASVLEIGEPGQAGAFRVVVRGTGDDAEIARQRAAATAAGI